MHELVEHVCLAGRVHGGQSEQPLAGRDLAHEAGALLQRVAQRAVHRIDPLAQGREFRIFLHYPACVGETRDPPSGTDHTPRMTELLAPAGDAAALDAALAAGADAVYFGLDEGFNARARAANFTLAALPEVCARIHRAGARAYLTLNTLVFEGELPRVESILRVVAAAGVDALIVQDPAVALLARAVCPDLELHASTQMTICNPDAARFAMALGVTRVVVPRELSIAEIRRFKAEAEVELEVFVHGALCVSWSGQCLTSEAWGGRSANRGQCAQSCRMPYDLVLDGSLRDLRDLRYLLSPKDLAGARALPELVAIGVHGLKIEGRQKGPQYVSTAVAGYRRWLDAVRGGAAGVDAQRQLALDLRDMTSAYSRGFSDGFFAGSDHQTLIEGRFPKHRGHYLGRVARVEGDEVVVVRDPEGRPWTGARAAPASARAPRGELASPLRADPPAAAPPEVRPGMGVVFDAGRPETDEAGGPIFRVDALRDGWRLGFGRPGPDLTRVRAGERVWLTSDPRVAAMGGPGDTSGRIPLSLRVAGGPGAPLHVEARVGSWREAVASAMPLRPATGSGLDAVMLRDKLGALGGTPFHLAELHVDALAPGLHLPVSELKVLRRTFVASLERHVARGPERTLIAAPALPRLRADTPAPSRWTPGQAPQLVPLVRSDAQLEAAIAAGLPEVELDWMEMVGLGRAVARAREAGLGVVVATLRVTKPGERTFDERLLKLAPDGILVRHFGALVLFGELPVAERPILHGDFSLNVTNSITARTLFASGLDTLTPSHDLDEAQLRVLLAGTDAARCTATLHVRMPTFHTEHCVYSHLLSNGRDFHSCGRPCERHQLALRDHLGLEHPVIVDAGCRNTVFNGTLQTSAALLPGLVRAGVRRFRVEFVREDAAGTTAALAAYAALLRGELAAGELHQRLRAEPHVGVATRAQETLHQQ